jgi:hypothetical protein
VPVVALDPLLELGIDVHIIFESAWPTWLITHSTWNLFASSAIEM